MSEEASSRCLNAGCATKDESEYVSRRLLSERACFLSLRGRIIMPGHKIAYNADVHVKRMICRLAAKLGVSSSSIFKTGEPTLDTPERGEKKTRKIKEGKNAPPASCASIPSLFITSSHRRRNKRSANEWQLKCSAEGFRSKLILPLFSEWF